MMFGDLISRPVDNIIIGTRWILGNIMGKNGIITRNKARLLENGYSQAEGIDHEETYASIARLEAIRLLLAFACYLNF